MSNSFVGQVKAQYDCETVLLLVKVTSITIRDTFWHISVMPSPEDSDNLIWLFRDLKGLIHLPEALISSP